MHVACCIHGDQNGAQWQGPAVWCGVAGVWMSTHKRSAERWSWACVQQQHHAHTLAICVCCSVHTWSCFPQHFAAQHSTDKCNTTRAWDWKPCHQSHSTMPAALVATKYDNAAACVFATIHHTHSTLCLSSCCHNALTTTTTTTTVHDCLCACTTTTTHIDMATHTHS